MKTVLVTGGNKGIGVEITRYFLVRDFKVICIARDFSDFALTNSTNVQCIHFDLTELEKIPQLVNDIGHIDVLVNNSGATRSLQFDQYPTADIDYMLRLNIQAPVALINAVATSMIEKKSGRIVNNSSLAGHIGHPDIWYGITKAGLINATKSYAKILGPHGIMINAVAAGPVALETDATTPGSHREIFKKTMVNEHFCTAKEVAETIGWLATESPTTLNGTCIDINNGAFMR